MLSGKAINSCLSLKSKTVKDAKICNSEVNSTFLEVLHKYHHESGGGGIFRLQITISVCYYNKPVGGLIIQEQYINLQELCAYVSCD